MKYLETISEGFRNYSEMVDLLSRYELEDLENAIYVSRINRMTVALEHAGFKIKTTASAHDEEGSEWQFNLILVFSPISQLPNEWATLDECQRLLDTVANLSPDKAYERWSKKIAPIDALKYTKAMAIEDTKQARLELKKDFEAGMVNGEDFRLMHASTSFMDLASR